MDGWLQKQLSFRMGLGVAAQCGRKCSQTRTEPTNAPDIWAVTYGTSFEKLPLATATPKVTAGFMCASLLPQAKAVKIPAMAAMAQPVDIEIHPPPSALERDKTTSAITPLPSKTSTMVPINSPNIGESIRVLSTVV
jgi:hypothetical protein